MTRTFELWDGETGNCIGAYDSEASALQAVRHTVDRYGRSAAETLALAYEDEDGDGGTIAAGAALIDYAKAAATAHAAQG